MAVEWPGADYGKVVMWWCSLRVFVVPVGSMVLVFGRCFPLLRAHSDSEPCR